MDEVHLSAIATQLKMPHGESAAEVGEKMNEGNAFINEATIRELDAKGNEEILEIGMGNGFFIKEILERDTRVKYVGCDHSEIMIDQASKNNERFIQNGQAKFFHGCASELPFRGETFDKVFTVNTIYFWEDPNPMLGEFHRVMKPDGKLLIAIRPESVMKHYPFVKYGLKTYSKEDLFELLTLNQFNVDHVTELDEPDQVISGTTVEVKTLIVHASKVA